MSNERTLLDELRFAADFPHELAGQEHLDKYLIYRWLIGHAVLAGCTYTPDPPAYSLPTGILQRGDETVSIGILAHGVHIGDEMIETQR